MAVKNCSAFNIFWGDKQVYVLHIESGKDLPVEVGLIDLPKTKNTFSWQSVNKPFPAVVASFQDLYRLFLK